LDLNGVPRPIHSKHGVNVVNTAYRRSAIDGVLRPQPRVLREGPGWREVLLVVPASLGRYGLINLGNAPCKVTKTLLK